MEAFEILLLSVEASIALAGFAGIIATFQINDVTRIRRGPIGALTVVVQFSLMTALTAGLILVLYSFGLTDAVLWTVSSLIAGIFTANGAYGIAKKMKGAIRKKSVRSLFILLQLLGVLIVLANILNIVGILFHREPGPVLAAILYALGVAAYMFSRLLLLPLWRIVREQEAVNSNTTE